MPAVFPATIVLVSVAEPSSMSQAAAVVGGVAADGAVGERGRAVVPQAAAVEGGRVAADGAVGERGRAVDIHQATADASRTRSCR